MKPVSIPDFMEELAFASGEAILPFFRSRIGVSDKAGKGHFDPVTEADRAAELVIRQRIMAKFPEHGIIGEEFDDVKPDAEFRWVIDPIDGTRAFICGLPVWGTLIGLTRNGVPTNGLLHQPYTRELFIGDGKSALLRNTSGKRTLAVRNCEALSDAFMMTTTPHLFKGSEGERYFQIERAVRMTRYGADCYAYAMLAAGQIDLVVECGLKIYDIVPLVPIIEGAGGIVTDWDGNPVRSGGNVVAAGDRRMHAAALHHLRSG
jgi:histidinol phosphatase-like enzyme (inositol monophosphatase family)